VAQQIVRKLCLAAVIQRVPPTLNLNCRLFTLPLLFPILWNPLIGTAFLLGTILAPGYITNQLL
jgi:hypothetical protein